MAYNNNDNDNRNKNSPTVEELLRDGAVTTTTLTHQAEETVRSNVTDSVWTLFLINGYSAIKVFLFHLISLETVFSICMSVGFTLLVYYERENVSCCATARIYTFC